MVLPVITLAMHHVHCYIPQRCGLLLIEVLHSPEVEGARGRGSEKAYPAARCDANVLPFSPDPSQPLSGIALYVAIVEHSFRPGTKMLIEKVAIIPHSGGGSLYFSWGLDCKSSLSVAYGLLNPR